MPIGRLEQVQNFSDIERRCYLYRLNNSYGWVKHRADGAVLGCLIGLVRVRVEALGYCGRRDQQQTEKRHPAKCRWPPLQFDLLSFHASSVRLTRWNYVTSRWQIRLTHRSQR